MAAEKLLSEAACKTAKAKATIYYLNDGAGLRMRIRPDGSRTWIYRYRLDGKEMSTGLGAYPTISLQIARANAQEARLEVSRGNNVSRFVKVSGVHRYSYGRQSLYYDEYLNAIYANIMSIANGYLGFQHIHWVWWLSTLSRSPAHPGT